MQYRLETEYNAECRVEPAPWQFVRWVVDGEGAPLASKPELLLPSGCQLARDPLGMWCALLPSEWTAAYLIEKNPDSTFATDPPAA
jgi:peptide chain release factor 3